MYTLMVADDEYFVRMGMREAIDWEKIGVKHIGDADNGNDAYKMACELKPDIIITDIRMPGMDGLELIDACQKAGLNSQFIILSAHNDFNYARRALQQGACDYILKPVSDEQLFQAVKKAINSVEKERNAVRIQSTVDRYQSSMKENVLLKILLETSFTEDEIQEQLDMVSLDFSADNNYVLILRIRDYYLHLKNSSEKELSEFHISFNDNLRRVMAPYPQKDWWLLSDERSRQIVLLHDTSDEKDASALLKQQMNEFCRLMEKRFPDYLISVGISCRLKSLHELSEGYTQAYMAAYINTVIPQNCVNCFSGNSGEKYRLEVMGALNYISAHYSEDISIETIASELYISSSHLMHIFKESMGKTINECITEYRMQAAQLMLRNSNYKISEISKRCGYRNEKYFTRVFKRYTGMTPSEYVYKNY